MTPSLAVPPRSCETIVRDITEQIRDGRLVRGQKLLTELRLCGVYGVSRAVVREAVRTLDAMGLVESRRGSGNYVRTNPIPSITRALSFSVTAEEHSVAALFEFRATLEASAAHLAARRATPAQRRCIGEAAAASMAAAEARDVYAFRAADNAFHAALAEAAGNAYLSVSVTAVRQIQTEVTHLIMPMRGTLVAAREHLRITAAIADGDADAAEEAMREHIHYSAGRTHEARGSMADAAGA